MAPRLSLSKACDLKDFLGNHQTVFLLQSWSNVKCSAEELKVNHTVRLVERSYFPVLQRRNPTTERWETVMEFKHKDKDIPLDVALKPKLPAHLIRIIDVASADEAYVTPPRGHHRGD